jgi:hypothetical protein
MRDRTANMDYSPLTYRKSYEMFTQSKHTALNDQK